MQTILIAHEEKLIVDTLVLIVRSAGYNAIPAYTMDAYTLEDVLAAAKTSCPDLAIIDSFNGDTSALDAAIQLRRRGCAIVLMSGESDTAEPCGYHDFTIVSKPINPTDLLSMVRRILNSRSKASKCAA